MSRVIGTHAGCGGSVVAPAGSRYCSKCLLTSHVTVIELTEGSEPPKCRRCQAEITDDNVGHWPSLGCCTDCEYRAIQQFVIDAEIAAAKGRAA